MIHNRADEYNLFEDHALGWEADLKSKGFDVTTEFPSEDGEDGCNSHITALYGPNRKAHFQKICSHWEQVFNVAASCETVLAFDTMVTH